MVLETLVTAAVLCNNFNLNSYPCSAPPESRARSGLTTAGIPYKQTYIVNDFTHLERMDLQDAHWYISDLPKGGGIIWADTDLEALSIYLAS